MLKVLIRVALLVLILPPTTAAQENTTLTVFAAASLTDAFEEIATRFEAEYPGVEVVFNFAGSSDLAAQLAQGAPADVFASANLRQMSAAQEAGRIAGEPRIFAENRLVLILPVDNPAEIESLEDLAQGGILLVLAAEGVPVRDYTNTMLDKLGEDYREAVLDNLVSEEPNVRQVAAKIALGEADAGIVYVSDVTPDLREAVITLPIADEYNTIASYPIAITDDAADPALAAAFVDYILSVSGQLILARWGFIPAWESLELW